MSVERISRGKRKGGGNREASIIKNSKSEKEQKKKEGGRGGGRMGSTSTMTSATQLMLALLGMNRQSATLVFALFFSY
jgi:hypothetical protein